MKKYTIPRHVEERTVLFNGSFQQFLIWLPFLIVGIWLFFLLSGMCKVMVPSTLIGLGYVLSTMKMDRETYWELIVLQLKYGTQRKTLYWERGSEFDGYHRIEYVQRNRRDKIQSGKREQYFDHGSRAV